jgi:hypothetical protein
MVGHGPLASEFEDVPVKLPAGGLFQLPQMGKHRAVGI